MSTPSQPLAGGVHAAGAAGLCAWLAYAIVENVFVFVVPAVTDASVVHTRWHWAFSGLLLVVYPLAGWLLGAATGLVVSRAARLRTGRPPIPALYRCIANLTVIGAFAAQTYRRAGPAVPTRTLLALAFALALLQFLATRTSARSKRLRPVANPWASALALVVPAWATTLLPASAESDARVVTALVTFAAILLGVHALGGPLERLGRRLPAFATRPAAWGLSVLLVAGVNALLIHPRPDDPRAREGPGRGRRGSQHRPDHPGHRARGPHVAVRVRTRHDPQPAGARRARVCSTNAPSPAAT